MEFLFMNILNMSFNAGIVILAVLLLRCLLKKVPKIFSYCLWAVVLFRLLCPVSFQSDWSLVGVINRVIPWQEEAGETIWNAAGFYADGTWLEMGMDETVLNESGNYPGNLLPVGNGFTDEDKKAGELWKAENAGQAMILSGKMQSILRYGTWIWAAGIAVMLLYSFVSIVKLKKQLKDAEPESKNIYISRSVPTPFVMGLRKPRIYLPALLEEREKEYILLHEQVHIRRGDHLIKAAGFLALSIHWFNPLVWIAFVLSGKDMEMSCDEAVLRKLGTDVKKEYSTSLLKLAVGKAVISGAPLGFGEGDTKGRIKNILSYRKTAVWIVCVTVVVSIAAILFLGANPKEVSATDISGNDKEVVTESEEREENEEQKENEYAVNVRTISEEERCIDNYLWADESIHKESDEKLVFSEDCQFYVNCSMISWSAYRTSDFEEFADLINAGNPDMSKPCMLTIEDGIVVEAKLENAYYMYGICYSIKSQSDGWYEHVLEETGGNIEKYYTLVDVLYADVSPRSGSERIEIYTGNSGDGESGLFMVYGEDGELLYTEGAHTARAGWNNIYLCKKDGYDYILTVHLEDRDSYFGCDYQVFRIGIDGGVVQTAGSGLASGENYLYDEELYETWVSCMESFWQEAASLSLVLSTQDGVLCTRKIGGNEDDSNDESLLYHSVLQTLTNEQYYAFVNIGAKYPVLLVTDATYEYTEGIKAAMDSEVYYVWDGKAVDLGMIASTGTAYPVSYDETGIYVAGGHFAERYALDEENRRLYVAEAANVVYDEEGNETYSYGTDGELEIVEDATYFNELFEKYALTTLADFK